MDSDPEKWRHAFLAQSANMEDAIANLDRVAIKIVLVVNEDNEFVGTISDGDIRRGLLRGLNLGSPISEIVHQNAFVVPPGLDRETILQLMTANKVQQIPILDDLQHVVGIHLWDELATFVDRPNTMLIMAGGKGTRLMPHTENCPKPMVKIAGKPMLEHIIDRAKNEGFRDFLISIHHLGEIIEAYFGNGEKFDVRIEYLREDKPLGTAGALTLFSPRPKHPFIVTNGDVMTDIQYGKLLDFHIKHGAVATMAVRLHEWQHPFGVVQTDGLNITGFAEKPISRSHINAGVYVLNPEAIDALLDEESCDMPTLFERLQAQALPTIAYPMHEPWMDVGRPDDLLSANASMKIGLTDKNDG